MKSKYARVLLLTCGVIWGMTFVVSSVLMKRITPLQLVALRFALGFFGVLLLFFPAFRTAKKRDYLVGFALGVILFLAVWTQMEGLSRTSPSKGSFFLAMNIIFVPFLARLLFRRSLRFSDGLGAFISFLGLVALSYQSGEIGGLNIGDVLTLICAVFYALQIVVMDRYAAESDFRVILMMELGVTGCFAILLSIFTETQPMLWDSSIILPALFLGLGGTSLTYLILSWAQRYIPPTETSILISTDSFFGILFSVILLHEPFTWNLVLGSVLLFSGVLIVITDGLQILRNQSNQNHERQSNEME
ncbi:MAG: DMT family transporter [Peptoniphilaceae bacterium]|nr:DMT family transporter [Peptoniphilaceae bacterium]